MHTPGPWAEDDKHTGGARAIIGDGQQLVALVYGKTAEEQADNAKLITASLTALRLVDELYSHAWDRADGGLSMFGSSVAKFEAAHKAVREALGIKLLAYEEE